jgi:hypothetical protein
MAICARGYAAPFCGQSVFPFSDQLQLTEPRTKNAALAKILSVE